MSKNPAKDFGAIADDYVFFESHATQAEQDARAYVDRLASIVPAQGPIRLLDFGCGSGSFTARFLQQTGWPRERLQITLVEPAASVRCQAITRLAGFTATPVGAAATLPTGTNAGFDVVLANQVFYYVPELHKQLAWLVDALAPAGVFLTALAARTNKLIEFWITGFRLLGQRIPYNTAEDVEIGLQQVGVVYQKQQVAYELTIADTEENRMRILRFLLADHLAHMPQRPLLDLFNQYAQSGLIKIPTASEHFTIRAKDEYDE